MRRYYGLLLNVWREACRHIEIGESTAKIASALAGQLPIDRLIVMRLDLQHGCLETVASQSPDGRPLSFPGRIDLSAEQLKALVAWGGQKRVARRANAAGGDLFRLIAPEGLDADALAGPLWSSEGLAGVLILVTPPTAALEERHHDLLETLLEPLSAALENDRRLHEMRMLREAAEADRRTLLRRLGRKEIATAIVGADAGLRHVMERIETVCRSDVPVLLLGDTGTGKEVVARAIHDRSARHDGPFIRVNCGAVPPGLIDSQLFGHQRGSFTGAVDTHRGWFERADGGTLFLDEIGELPLAAQVRLLRVVQDGFLERIGGGHSIHVDVRIVAATHRDLAAMVRDEAFREDLWYRIAVFPIPIPPLRQRPEDIPALACHFAEKAATRFGLPLIMPTPEDMRLLAGYAWPGNVRELAAVIDRAALLGNGRKLEVGTSLGAAPTIGPSESTDRSRATVSPTMPRVSRPGESLAGSDTRVASDGGGVPLDAAVRSHIENALRISHGRIEGPFGAARHLDINPHTLRSRMRRMGIDWRKYRD